MSNKPKDIGGYSQALTEDCERVLITLLAGLHAVHEEPIERCVSRNIAEPVVT